MAAVRLDSEQQRTAKASTKRVKRQAMRTEQTAGDREMYWWGFWAAVEG